MRHLSQDDLILHYYREAGPGMVKHLADCPECQENFEQLSCMLSAIALPEPPPRGEDYGAEVWGRIRHKLNEGKTAMPWWALSRRWAGRRDHCRSDRDSFCGWAIHKAAACKLVCETTRSHKQHPASAKGVGGCARRLS